MTLDWHRNSPGGRGRAFPGLKPIIFDDCDEIDPLPVLIPVPRGDAVRFGLLDNGAQHMFQQSIRLGLLRQRVQRVRERIQLAAGNVLRGVQGFRRSLAFRDVR